MLTFYFNKVLGWQVMAGKIGMQRCAASSQWFNERVLLSRYAHVTCFYNFITQKCILIRSTYNNAHDITCNFFMQQVPIGNFEIDWLLFTADVFFSRALRDQQQVITSLVGVDLYSSSLLSHACDACDHISFKPTYQNILQMFVYEGIF